MATADEPKKKRRQNVACDSCKFRRVKCDLSNILYPSDPTCSSGPSLSELVKQNPDVECTNCKNKEIRCSTNQILNPVRPKKGGRRIEEAKRRFGDEEAEASVGTAAGQAEFPGDQALDWSAIVDGSNPFAGLPTFGNQVETSQLQSLPDFLFDNSGSTNSTLLHPQPPFQLPQEPSSSSWNAAIPNPFNTPAHFDPSQFHVQSTTHPFDTSLFTQSQPNSDTSARDSQSPPEKEDAFGAEGPLQRKFYGADADAAQVWDTSWAKRQSQKDPPTHDPNNPRFRHFPASPSFLEAHQPSSSTSSVPTLIPQLPPYDNDLNSFVQWKDIFTPPRSSSATALERTSKVSAKSLSSQIASPAPSRSSVSSHLVPGRKRIRMDEVSVSSVDDPWKIWADEEEGVIVRWSRRDVVEQKLADRALGSEMSKHLIKTFFHCVHPSFPALSPEGFYVEWERAGQQSDRMTLAQEALCAIMEAWGARYSDNPVVLGLSQSKAHTAPKVILPNGTLAPGTQARAHWGRSRLGVCNALADRARKLIDYNGLLRTPSVTGLQALILYNQLLHLTDQKSRAVGQYMESQLIHATIIEQMKMLQLMWDSTGQIPSEEGEMPVTIAQMRLKQRRIFWTVIVSDALNAAATGEIPKIPEEEVSAVADWLSAVESKLPMSTFKTLAFFMSCYHRLSLVGRVIGRSLTHPNKKPGTVNVQDFCATVRECWTQVQSIARDVVDVTTDLLRSSKKTLLGFSPLNYVSNLRMSCPFLLLILHQAIREQLDFRKNLKESYIVDESSSSSTSPPGPEESNVAMLEELHMQSVDVLLYNCRSQVSMYKTVLPTGMVQTAAIFLRVLIATAQFLAEVPTVEQGYPNTTLGGYGWTWETKQKEIAICVEALYQLGWAWADVGDVLNSVMLALERMQPSAECFNEYAKKAQEVDQRIIQIRQQDEESQRRVLERAMEFWPPESVPTLLEAAMNELRLEEGDKSVLELDTKSIPWKDLENIRKSDVSRPSTPSTQSERVSEKLWNYFGHQDSDIAQASGVQFTGSSLAPAADGPQEEYGGPLRVARGSTDHPSVYVTPSSIPHHPQNPTRSRSHQGLNAPAPSGWMDGFNYSQATSGNWSISGVDHLIGDQMPAAKRPYIAQAHAQAPAPSSQMTTMAEVDHDVQDTNRIQALPSLTDSANWNFPSEFSSWLNLDTTDGPGSNLVDGDPSQFETGAAGGLGMFESDVADLEKLLMDFEEASKQ